MTIRSDEKIVFFHEKQRKQRNVISGSSEKIILGFCVSLFISALFFLNASMDFRISKPEAGINPEIERKSYVGAVVDVSVITTQICNKVKIYLSSKRR